MLILLFSSTSSVKGSVVVSCSRDGENVINKKPCSVRSGRINTCPFLPVQYFSATRVRVVDTREHLSRAHIAIGITSGVHEDDIGRGSNLNSFTTFSVMCNLIDSSSLIASIYALEYELS